MRYFGNVLSGTIHYGRTPTHPEIGDLWVLSERTQYVWIGKWSKFR